MNISGLNIAMGILIFVLVYAVVVLYIDLISLQKTNSYLNCKIIQLKSRLNDDLENEADEYENFFTEGVLTGELLRGNNSYFHVCKTTDLNFNDKNFGLE